MTIDYAISYCRLGHVLVARTAEGICAIEIGDTPDETLAHLVRRHPDATLREMESLSEMEPIVAVLDGTRATLDVPLAPVGTDYQRRVWERLRAIPAGSTLTYLEIATAMGDPGSLRAVAGACAANPLAVVIPCHRVLRTDGGLGGYRWGVERKRQLLVREGALDALSLFDPR
jgi:AraC family transcriptional regulator of adaptative response/methylated-DNA-[protein]-cysteine methyltransferase